MMVSKRLKQLAVAGLLMATLVAGSAWMGGRDVAAQSLSVEIPDAWQGGGITVTGVGSVEVEADVANVSMGVEVISDTVVAARNEAAIKLSAMLDAIKSEGVMEENIRTSGLQISPETVWVQEEITLDSGDIATSGRSRIIGYRVTNRVDVSMDDVSIVGAVVDAAAAAAGDATRIYSIYFTVSDGASAMKQARLNAALDARATAALYANALGVELGPAVSMSESSGADPFVSGRADRDFAVESVYVRETPISPGTTTLQASVRVTFAILGLFPEIQQP